MGRAVRAPHHECLRYFVKCELKGPQEQTPITVPEGTKNQCVPQALGVRGKRSGAWSAHALVCQGALETLWNMATLLHTTAQRHAPQETLFSRHATPHAPRQHFANKTYNNAHSPQRTHRAHHTHSHHVHALSPFSSSQLVLTQRDSRPVFRMRK